MLARSSRLGRRRRKQAARALARGRRREGSRRARRGSRATIWAPRCCSRRAARPSGPTSGSICRSAGQRSNHGRKALRVMLLGTARGDRRAQIPGDGSNRGAVADEASDAVRVLLQDHVGRGRHLRRAARAARWRSTRPARRRSSVATRSARASRRSPAPRECAHALPYAQLLN